MCDFGLMGHRPTRLSTKRWRRLFEIALTYENAGFGFWGCRL